jgi:HEPN domain-containing protein
MKNDTQLWMEKAKEDFDSAEILLTAAKFNTSCYHSQQSSEKYLKSVLCELNLEIPKTHNLNLLVQLLKDTGVVISEEVLDSASEIDRYATLTRYPGYDACLSEAEECVLNARNVKVFVEKHLVHPTSEND